MAHSPANADPAPRGPLGLLSSRDLTASGEWLGRAAAESALPFLLVVYLALKGGGYDPIVYGQVGIAVWWLVLLGAAVGVLPRARIPAAAWVGFGLIGAFAVWTALGIGWSQSAERSTAELGRVATYLGIFALSLAAQRPGSLRRTANAVGAAIAVVGALALLSRFHPSWFPANEAARYLPATRARLNYPLNYWNGLAALAAIGIPLLLVAARKARTLVGQGLAAAAVPALALTAFYTLSRGGALEVAAALVVLLALYPRRLELLPTLALTALGGAILIVGATQRDALESGLLGSSAGSQGGEMLAMTLVVCAGVGLVQIALGLSARHGLGPRIAVPRRTAIAAGAATLVVAVAIALAAGLPGYLSDRWHDFKQPISPASTDSAQSFESTGGGGRYQYWQSALDAEATAPLTGIGPGTFQYWWAENGTIPGFIRDAHSLYFQTLAETGIAGLALLGGLIAFLLLGGARAARTASRDRSLIAGAVAACAAFSVAAAIDWVWELPVLPVAFLLLGAAVLAGRERGNRDADAASAAGLRPLGRAAIAAVSLASLVAIALPLGAASALHTSQADARANQLSSALQKARSAHDLQPYAATPSLQQALIYELQGDLPDALSAARAATAAESTNWRTWLVLSRLEAESGQASASLNAYKRARALNPRSPLFAQ